MNWKIRIEIEDDGNLTVIEQTKQNDQEQRLIDLDNFFNK
jgi:hypothetical protein